MLHVPELIQKFCFTDRRETAHRRLKGISRANLYQCTVEGCTAPAREVTDPKTQGQLLVERAAQMAEKERWRKESEADSPARRQETMKKKEIVVPTTSGARTPLIAAIERIVDQKLGAVPAGITAADVRSLVQTELASALGISPAGPDGHVKHRGPCGKRCKLAAA